MKQLLQNLRSGETFVAEVPMPVPGPGMALVRTAASLVSAGTERILVEFAEKSLVGKARSRPDLVRQVIDKARREGLLTTVEAAFNRLDQPMPLGYSSAGTVTGIGEGLQGYRVGDRVVCAGGGYAVHAEYARVPRNLLASIPDNVDFEAAAFTTLGAIALHGFRLTEAQVGERVGVIGLGLLGLLAAGIVRAAGCQVLGIDTDTVRVELARRLGAQAINRQEAEEAALAFTNGNGLDSILICAATDSSDPVELAGIIARERARVVAVGAVGLTIPRRPYYEKELFFVNSRSYGPGRYDPQYEEGGHDYPLGYVRWTEGRNMQAFLGLLAAGQVDVKPLITHRFPLERAPEAYQLITGKIKEPFLGVLLTYPAPAGVSPATGISSPVEAAIGSVIKKDSRLRLGVLGAGNFANAVMLPALKKIPQIDMVAVTSASGMHAYHAAHKFGFQHAAEDEAHILADPSINTVAILTRHNLHARQVIAALQAGKHVFCEKPLALTAGELAEIEEVIDEIQSREAGQIPPFPNPMLMVGFNRRFAPLARRLRQFMQARQEPLVAHYRVNAGYLPTTHWLHDPEQGGGRIIGEGCHFIDFLTFLVGDPPISVTAAALPDSERYHEDNAILTFTFPDGSLGTLSYLANGDKSFPKERVEVFAGGRVGALDDFRSLELAHDGKHTQARARLRQDKGHQAEWEAFAAAILSGGSPPVPYTHLFGVARASFAAVEALRSKEQIRIA